MILFIITSPIVSICTWLVKFFIMQVRYVIQQCQLAYTVDFLTGLKVVSSSVILSSGKLFHVRPNNNSTAKMITCRIIPSKMRTEQHDTITQLHDTVGSCL